MRAITRAACVGVGLAMLAATVGCGQDAPPPEAPTETAAPDPEPEPEQPAVPTPAPPEPAMTPLEAGRAFLQENGMRANVVTTASGLQYEVLVPGEGDSPSAADTVTTHYHGTLINGRVFDSSVQRGEPIAFPVNRVIQGWQEALPMMQVGAKWKLYIPSDLAYGASGMGDIGPNETLIFEVELLDFQRRG